MRIMERKRKKSRDISPKEMSKKWETNSLLWPTNTIIIIIIIID